jgi:hypothetical protein
MVGSEEVDPGGCDLSADHRGLSEGLYRTVYDELENCVDFLTGIVHTFSGMGQLVQYGFRWSTGVLK